MKIPTAVSVILTLLVVTVGLVGAQGAGGDIVIADSEVYGEYLATADGMALYMFTDDVPYTSTCTGQCAENWPPFTLEGTPMAGEGVAVVQVGTIQREDGTRQVTYAGWPLYTFAQDEAPGDLAGHGVGDAWYLVSPEGAPIRVAEGAGMEEEAAAEQPEGDATPESEAESEGAEEADAEGEITSEVMAEGEQIYARNCASCHGDRGRGVVGPALAGNESTADASAVARQIVHGRDEMPPFGGILDDAQIAAVGTFIRNSWGNAFGPLSVEQVAEQR